MAFGRNDAGVNGLLFCVFLFKTTAKASDRWVVTASYHITTLKPALSAHIHADSSGRTSVRPDLEHGYEARVWLGVEHANSRHRASPAELVMGDPLATTAGIAHLDIAIPTIRAAVTRRGRTRTGMR
jgi:hypothetical protein